MKLLKSILPEKQLLKVLSLNSISTLVKIVSGFILSKVIAIYIGPKGIGLAGNLRSFFASIQSISSLGFSNGIIKLTAEYKTDKNKLSKIVSTSFFIGGIAVILISLALFIFSKFWSVLILNEPSYELLIKVLALALPFITINYLLLAVINGVEKYKIYVLTNIIGSIISLVFTTIFILNFNLKGLLFSIVILPALGLIVSLSLLLKHRNLYVLFKIKNIDLTILKNLSEYSLMAIISALLIPTTLIAIRNHIITVSDLIHAGYWEAMNRISNYYLLFVSSLLSLYLYPKLSIAKDTKSFRKEVFSIYKTLIPLIIIGLLILFFLRSFAIRLLLSEDFIPVEKLFFWQLLGDFFKIASSVLAYQFFAKKLTKDYIITEITSVVIWYSSSIYFINYKGYIGASIGYFVCYFTYFFLLLFWFRKKLFH